MAASGRWIRPRTEMDPRSPDKGRRAPASSLPHRSATLAVTSLTEFSFSRVRSPEASEMETWGLARAKPIRTSLTARVSAEADLRNFLRAGALKKRFLTSTVVPGRRGKSSTATILPASTRKAVPATSSTSRVSRESRDTAAMDGRASPRKPRELHEQDPGPSRSCWWHVGPRREVRPLFPCPLRHRTLESVVSPHPPRVPQPM